MKYLFVINRWNQQHQILFIYSSWSIKSFKVISWGERYADATDVQGVSATKARAFARAGDFDSFAQTIDGGPQLKKEIFNKVRQGMGVTESKKPVPPKKPNPVAKQLTDPKFRPQTVKDKKKEIDKKKLPVEIEIDGGINFDNAKIAKKAGVDILVSGTTIFKNNEGNIKKNIEILRNS